MKLYVERVVEGVRRQRCQRPARVKKRAVVSYVDPSVYGAAMRLTWKKHRMRCVNEDCPQRSSVLRDHRIAAKNCLLTTRAAKWATVQVGTGRTVKKVAKELNCDWHAVNDTVTTYGTALLKADHRRHNRTSDIGLDETSSVKLGGHHTSYATAITDVEHHQITEHPAHAQFRGRRGVSRPTERGLEVANHLRRPRHVQRLRRRLLGDPAQQPRWSIIFT